MSENRKNQTVQKKQTRTKHNLALTKNLISKNKYQEKGKIQIRRTENPC